ncbi:MAG: hypothetical protein ACQESD_07310, partial [Thermoplasmatota archaeon]
VLGSTAGDDKEDGDGTDQDVTGSDSGSEFPWWILAVFGIVIIGATLVVLIVEQRKKRTDIEDIDGLDELLEDEG